MAKLVITTDQEGAIVAIEPFLEAAFLSGTEDTFAVPVVDAMPLYDDPAVVPVKTQVKGPFKALVAAFMKAVNIKRALPTGISATIVLAKLTGGGSNGSLTFIDGLLTAKVDPT